MSGNSCCSALQTAPMVSDFWRWTGSGWSSAPSASAGSVTSGSLNGTYVNRQRVDSHQLADGDELQIGKFKLTFFAR